MQNDERMSDRPCDIVTTYEDNNSNRKEASQACQNLSHSDSVSDQKLTSNSTSAPPVRGKAHINPKRQNKPHVVDDRADDEYRSERSVHVPADSRSSASNVKENWTARQNDSHHTAYTSRVGAERSSRQSRGMKEQHRDSPRGRRLQHEGGSSDCSRRTLADAARSRDSNGSEKLNISEDWESELYVMPSSESNLTVTATNAVGTPSDVVFSVAAKGNEN